METRFAGKENSFDGLPLEFGGGVSTSVDLDELVGSKGVSFHSGLSSNLGAQVGQVAGSSKAVLAALRALQDKIRRLEIERSQALEEASQLRQQVKHYEIEIEHTKQREALANQKVMAEATSTKERLYTEKTELEVKLARAADRAAEQAKALGELEFKLRVLEEEKIRARSTIAEFEERTRALEGHMAQSSAREKEVAQTITWETRRHEDEVEALQSHISSLTQDLTTTQERGSELDGMVRQLLASNEALATQLSKAEKRAAKAAAEGGSSSSNNNRKGKGSSSESKAKESSSGRKKEGSGKVSNKAASTSSKQKVAARGLRPSTGAAAGGGSKRTKPSKSRTVVPVFKSLPHCANISTFAAEAQKASKVESSPNHWVPGGLRGVDDIHHQLKSSVESLNSAHSGLASVLSTSRVVVPPPQPRQAPLRGGKSHNSRQRASSVDSRDSRSSAASSTGSACSSASGRQRFSSQSSPGSKNPRGPGIALEGKPHKATTSSASSFWDGYDVLGAVAAKNANNASPGGRPSKAPPKPGSKASPAAAAKAAANVATQMARTQMARAQLAAPLVSASPARAPSTQSKSAPQVGTADSFANARDGDLQHVIQSLEEEFSALNHQYRSLLKTVSSPVGKASAEAVDASFDDDEKEGQLVDVIQKLHRKSEMLRKLKSPTKR